MNTEFIVVSVTFPSVSEAEKCIEDLLKHHLVSCCQMYPIQSIYRWKGKIEKADEISVILKSKQSLFSKIKECILKNHSYEVPEILSYPIIDGYEPYLAWIKEETEIVL